MARASKAPADGCGIGCCVGKRISRCTFDGGEVQEVDEEGIERA